MRKDKREKEEIYFDFASKISFFEFTQDEFKRADIDLADLKDEILALQQQTTWNIDDLSNFVRQHPKGYLIFQEIFQLLRFTNAQLIHFVFDIDKLNSLNQEAIFEYFIFNIKYDGEFRKVFLNLLGQKQRYEDFIKNIGKYDKKYLIAIFKTTISKYTAIISKKFPILQDRITKSEFSDFSIRFSNYLLNNLKLNETLSSINLEAFLRNKKIPIDTKSIHGKYAKIKIKNILRTNDFICLDDFLKKNSISTVPIAGLELPDDKKMLFCTEKYVETIIKPATGQPKKFDLIIFDDFKPKYLFEMNFYSTEGTKIGINEGEYIELNNYIKSKKLGCHFFWITDGNYWLTLRGKEKFFNLLNHFDKIYNINTFAEEINRLKTKLNL